MSQEALAKVKGPALGIKITAGIGIAYCVLNIGLTIFGVQMPGQEVPEGMEWLNAVGIGSSLIGIGVGVFLWISAAKMQRLEAYNQSLIAAILAVVPFCSPCCCIGIPVGVWAIIVLSKADVKEAFGQG
ncbi:MAG: hypothetical protein AAF682_00695 [Planctomycetota bacterium]